jgi:hypothetical protein
LRGLAGQPLAGRLELVAQPTPELAEGLGPVTLLPPGGVRAYAFRVPREGPIGVGVRADSGGVETLVFDGAGKTLGRGVVQWLSLAPGTYTLALVAPADGTPVAVRAAIVGTSPPGEGPPPEVLKDFLELERGGPAAGGRGIVVGAPDVPKPFLSPSSGGTERGDSGAGMRGSGSEEDEATGEDESGDEGEGSADEGGWR